MARGTIEEDIINRAQDGKAAGDPQIVIQLFELSDSRELPGQPLDDSMPFVAHHTSQSSLENMTIQPEGRQYHLTKHCLRPDRPARSSQAIPSYIQDLV